MPTSVCLGKPENRAHAQGHFLRNILPASSYLQFRDFSSQRWCLVYKITFEVFFQLFFKPAQNLSFHKIPRQSSIYNYELHQKFLSFFLWNLLPASFTQYSLLLALEERIIISYSPYPPFHDFTDSYTILFPVICLWGWSPLFHSTHTILSHASYVNSSTLLVVLLAFAVPFQYNWFLVESLRSEWVTQCACVTDLYSDTVMCFLLFS